MNATTKSKQLARIIGPLMIAMALTEYINFDIWDTAIPLVTYLNGTLLFLAGLSVIQSHNIWKGWPAIITAIGWLVLFAGLYRMTFPTANQMSKGVLTTITFGMMAVVGSYLSYKSYFQKSKP